MDPPAPRQIPDRSRDHRVRRRQGQRDGLPRRRGERRAGRAAPTDIATGDQTGARLWLATDTGIRGYDLGSRAEVARYDLGPTGALAHDPTASQLFAATETGELYTLDLTELDIGGAESVEPFQVADLGVPVDRLAVAEDGTTVLVTAGDRLLVVDSVTGEVTLDSEVPGLVEAADVGSGSAVVATPASIDDPAAVAGRLAELLGGDASCH